MPLKSFKNDLPSFSADDSARVGLIPVAHFFLLVIWAKLFVHLLHQIQILHQNSSNGSQAKFLQKWFDFSNQHLYPSKTFRDQNAHSWILSPYNNHNKSLDCTDTVNIQSITYQYNSKVINPRVSCLQD